jgi:hypothetical protein
MMRNVRLMGLAGLVLAIMLFLAVSAEAQYANKTGNVVGTAGGACSSAANDYAWPDTNGNILKCVSNIWTVQGTTAAAAGTTGTSRRSLAAPSGYWGGQQATRTNRHSQGRMHRPLCEEQVPLRRRGRRGS